MAPHSLQSPPAARSSLIWGIAPLGLLLAFWAAQPLEAQVSKHPQVDTFANLPTCGASLKGRIQSINDATSNGVCTAGGTATALCKCDGTSWIAVEGAGASDGVGYDEVLDEASGLTKRAQLNMIGAGISCVDNAGATRTDCTIAAGSGETNTASNLGGGLANFDSKSGVDLRFNTFAVADFDLGTNLFTIDDTKWAKDSELHARSHVLSSGSDHTGTATKAQLPAAIAYEDEANTFTGGTQLFQPSATTNIPFTIQALASQTADLLVVENSAAADEVTIGSDGTFSLGLTTTTAQLKLPSSSDAVTPTLAFGDGDSGIFEFVDDELGFAIAGVVKTRIGVGWIIRGNGARPGLIDEQPSATNAVLIPDQADFTTGVGSGGTGQVSIIGSAVEVARFNTAASGVNYIDVTPAATGSGPTIAAAGSDTNVSLSFDTKGTSKHSFKVNTSVKMELTAAHLIFQDNVLIRRDVNAGLTASTTQTQGQGALTAEFNEVATVANTNDTVTLPTAVAGLKIVIINNGANTLQIFPASGDNLGAGLNNSTTLASGGAVVYAAFDATNWQDEVADGHVNSISEIAAGIKRGPDATDTHIVTTDEAIPGARRCTEFDTDGSLIAAADSCANLGPGGTTAWDVIGDPTGAGTVAMADTVQDLTWDTPATATARDAFTLGFNHDATTDSTTQRGLVIERNATAGTLTLETLLQINNNDTDGAVTTGLEFTAVAGGMSVAIEASDPQITTILSTNGGALTSGDLNLLDDGTITLTTETTGNYAAGDAEAGAATTGDNAASFFGAGEMEVVRGGTGAASLTDGGILLGSGTSAITALGVAANGQIPIGDGATDPVLNEIDGTANEIDITNTAGAIQVGIVASPTLDGTNFTGIPSSAITTEVRSVGFDAFSMIGDGTQCPEDPSIVTLNSGPKDASFICTDNNASRLEGGTVMPDGWDGGTVTFELHYIQTAADTLILNSDIACQARGEGETTNDTFGTEKAIDDAAVTGSNNDDFTTSAAVTCDCPTSCQGGDVLRWRWELAVETTSAVTTLHFLDIKMEYVSNVGD